MGTTFKPGRR